MIRGFFHIATWLFVTIAILMVLTAILAFRLMVLIGATIVFFIQDYLEKKHLAEANTVEISDDSSSTE